MGTNVRKAHSESIVQRKRAVRAHNVRLVRQLRTYLLASRASTRHLRGLPECAICERVAPECAARSAFEPPMGCFGPLSVTRSRKTRSDRSLGAACLDQVQPTTHNQRHTTKQITTQRDSRVLTRSVSVTSFMCCSTSKPKQIISVVTSRRGVVNVGPSMIPSGTNTTLSSQLMTVLQWPPSAHTSMSLKNESAVVQIPASNSLKHSW